MSEQIEIEDKKQSRNRQDDENVFELLRKRYPAPAWAFLEEVRNGTGYGSITRTADALAMSLYPSRGLHLHGFEVKVSRADWVKELKDPAKAEEIAKFCHFWWLVIDDIAIVRPGEVPATWGLLVSDGKKLKVAREPTLNAEALPPSYKFLGAILRKVCSTSTDQVRIDRAREEGHSKGWAAAQAQIEHRNPSDAFKAPFEKLRDHVNAFEAASGCSIIGYGHGKVAATVRLLSGGWDSPLPALKTLAKETKAVAARLDEAIAEAVARQVVRELPEAPPAKPTPATDDGEAA